MQTPFKQAMRDIRMQDYYNIVNLYTDVFYLGFNAKWAQFYGEYRHADDEAILDDNREALQLLKYRVQLMQICCLSEVWEQDLHNFLCNYCKENRLTEQFNMITKENNYCVLQNGYRNLFNKDLASFNEITEMRNLVNAIKHGEGSSFGKLISELGDDILADSHFVREKDDGTMEYSKQREYSKNTLTNIVLKVDGIIQKYHNAIVQFWQETYDLIDKQLQ